MCIWLLPVLVIEVQNHKLVLLFQVGVGEPERRHIDLAGALACVFHGLAYFWILNYLAKLILELFLKRVVLYFPEKMAKIRRITYSYHFSSSARNSSLDLETNLPSR